MSEIASAPSGTGRLDLPVPADPAPGESLYGFLQRLAYINGREPVDVYALLALHHTERNLIPGMTKVLADLAGTLSHKIVPLLWIPSGVDLTVGTAVVPRWLVHRSQTRVCLKCLAEEATHLAAWDFRPVTLCMRHGVPLVSQCPVCRAILLRSRHNYRICPFHHDLRDFGDDPAPITDLRSLNLNQLLTAAIDNDPLLSYDIPALDPADIGLLARLCGTIARSSYRRYTRTWRSADDLDAQIGLPTVENWPHALHELLRPHLRNGVRPLPVFAPAVNRFLTSRLRKDADRPYVKLFGAEVWNLAEANGVTPIPGSYGHTPAGFRARFITPTEAARQMKTGVGAVYRIAHELQWRGCSQMNRKSAAWLLRSDVDAWCSANVDRIPLLHVARQFRAEARTILDLVHAGCFGDAALSRTPVDARQTWYATPIEVAVFMEKLRSETAHNRDHVGPSISWRQFADRNTKRRASLGSTIAAAFAGRVLIVAWKEPQLSRLEFNSDSLHRFQAEQIALLTFKDIASEYAFSIEVLREAARIGLLVPIDPITTTHTAFFERPVVAAFVASYTSSGKLAQTLNASIPQVNAALHQLGISPLNPERGRAPAIFESCHLAPIFDHFRRTKNGAPLHTKQSS